MATEKAQTPPPAAPAVKGPSLSDVNARDGFISVALGKILAFQLAESKVNELQAVVMAVRIANLVMAERRNTEVLNVVVAKGVKDVPATQVEEKVDVLGVLEETKPPVKSIAEIIGEPAETLAELK